MPGDGGRAVRPGGLHCSATAWSLSGDAGDLRGGSPPGDRADRAREAGAATGDNPETDARSEGRAERFTRRRAAPETDEAAIPRRPRRRVASSYGEAVQEARR